MGISTWVSARFFLKTITKKGTLTVQVAHTQEAAESLFRMVHRFVEQLPEELRKGELRTSKSSVRQILFPKLDSEYRVVSAGNLGAGGCFWREWQEAPATGMARHFFPWWKEEAYVGTAVDEGTLTEDERKLMRAHGLTHAQIGYRRELFANFRGLAKQEYAEDANACFLASGECVFERDVVDKRMTELDPPVSARLNGQLLVWLRPIAGREYLVSVDPAGGGTSGDYSVVQVVDLATGKQCAELRAKMSFLELATEAAKLGKEYNDAVAVVERNNHGAAVLAHLASTCKYAHIYEQDGQLGWWTSTLSKPQMIGTMASAVVQQPEMFSSERLLRECRTFVRHHNGSMAAQNGEYDDCAMAMAMGLHVRAELISSGGKTKAE